MRDLLNSFFPEFLESKEEEEEEEEEEQKDEEVIEENHDDETLSNDPSKENDFVEIATFS